MFEIGIPNFIPTKEYNNDPLKYGYWYTYKRGKYTLLVSHNGEFFSLLDIATTLKKFKIQSLFMIISKDKKSDEYTVLIGNSFYPYDKTLLHKSVIKKDENFEAQIKKMHQFIDMVKALLNTSEVIVFPIDVDDNEIKMLLSDSLEYTILDITKYLILTPTVEPMIKKMVPVIISIVIGFGAFYLSSYINDYFEYDYKEELQHELSISKRKLYAQMDIYREVKKKNDELKALFRNKNNILIYRGTKDD